MTERTSEARWAVPLVLGIVVAVWGAAFSGIKVLLRDLDAGTLTSARLLIAALSFTLFLPFAPRGRTDRRPGDLPRLLGAGFAATAGYHLSLNWGEQFVSAGLASLLVATMPVMVAIGAALVLGEALGLRRAAGAAVAFAGVAVLAAYSGQGFGVDSIAGVLVTLCAPLSWAAYTLISKPLSGRYDGVRLNLVGAWTGAVAVSPLGVAGFEQFSRLDAGQWAWLVYLGAVSQAATYVAYAWALGRRSASSVSSVVYLVPVASLAWAAVLLGERPHALSLVGGALIVAGVALVQRSGRGAYSAETVTPPPALASTSEPSGTRVHDESSSNGSDATIRRSPSSST